MTLRVWATMGRDVAGEEVLAVADADDERRAAAGADEDAGQVRRA